MSDLLRTSVLIALIAPTVTSASLMAQEKPKLAELLFVDKEDDVYARGVWRPDNPTKKNELMEAVSELLCFRHGGVVSVLDYYGRKFAEKSNYKRE